ncbi:unnamed protein product [Arctia plantaginis]|uniref:E3 ubiquitin-protein ligase RNF10 n=1 Tax=Arctia plantaginis TaxID=874455 RepID=A0A8S1A2Q8_ARCPL|nr:unnamed protein product [Arctia plantaginis]
MDKKSLNRLSQPQSKATAIDCKKTSAVELTQKPWSRNNNKKRDGPSTAPKNEPFRKNGLVHSARTQVEKRPRTRSTVDLSVGGTTNSRIGNDDEPEIGSVFVPGSKKQNFNHLKNFTYHSGGTPERRGQQSRRKQQQQKKRQQHQVPHRHENDLHLIANYQFVVKEDGDYKSILIDPKTPIKWWEQIEQIVVRGTGKTECPICLSPPTAGRVGKCGHVYCWACILHYAATRETRLPPCPVCIQTALHVKVMKPIRIVQWNSPAEEVTMRLVRRLRDSNTVEVAPPRGFLTEAADPILPLSNIDVAPYCKLFSATKQQVHDIIQRERDEIKQRILAEIDTTEIVFLEQALEMLRLKEEHINMEWDKPKVVEEKTEEVPIVYEKQEINQNKLDWFDVNEEGAACVEVVQNQMDELYLSGDYVTEEGAACVEVVQNQMDELNLSGDSFPDSNLNPEAPLFEVDGMPQEETPLTEIQPPVSEQATDVTITEIDILNQDKYFYFYQSDDGQHIFLHSLNIRVLKDSWGILAAAPEIITGRVLHRESFSVREGTTKPCTTHLPLNCSYDIVELDLQPPYVTDAALQTHTEEIERRARIRARHDRNDRRRERAYKRAMEGPPKPDFSSEVLFPPAPPSYSSPSVDPVFMSTFEMSSPSTSVGSPSSGPSFAKIASTSGTWRVREKPAETPPVAVEEEISAPRVHVLNDALEAALRAAPSPSGKKNKKTKQKLLFSTGMQRAA